MYTTDAGHFLLAECDIEYFDDKRGKREIESDGYYYRWKVQIRGRMATIDMVRVMNNTY